MTLDPLTDILSEQNRSGILSFTLYMIKIELHNNILVTVKNEYVHKYQFDQTWNRMESC